VFEEGHAEDDTLLGHGLVSGAKTIGARPDTAVSMITSQNSMFRCCGWTFQIDETLKKSIIEMPHPKHPGSRRSGVNQKSPTCRGATTTVRGTRGETAAFYHESHLETQAESRPPCLPCIDCWNVVQVGVEMRLRHGKQLDYKRQLLSCV
jgi:hypothetical protein